MVASGLAGIVGLTDFPLAESWASIFLTKGGFIGYVLWALSILMVGLIIQGFLKIRSLNIMPDMVKAEVRGMFDNKQYREVIEYTAQQPDVFSGAVHAGLREAARGYGAMEKALVEAADYRKTQLMRSLEYLNLLGNLGPMLGLLGTVLGLILAFFAIVAQGGNPDPVQLANALGMKLVCTFMGLVVAIPSLACYGLFRNRVDTLSSAALTEAQDLISSFKPGAKAAASAPATSGSMAK